MSLGQNRVKRDRIEKKKKKALSDSGGLASQSAILPCFCFTARVSSPPMYLTFETLGEDAAGCERCNW